MHKEFCCPFCCQKSTAFFTARRTDPKQLRTVKGVKSAASHSRTENPNPLCVRGEKAKVSTLPKKDRSRLEFGFPQSETLDSLDLELSHKPSSTSAAWSAGIHAEAACWNMGFQWCARFIWDCRTQTSQESATIPKGQWPKTSWRLSRLSFSIIFSILMHLTSPP